MNDELRIRHGARVVAGPQFVIKKKEGAMDDAMPPPRRQVPEIDYWICRGMFGPVIR
jgi:hypothetical protein